MRDFEQATKQMQEYLDGLPLAQLWQMKSETAHLSQERVRYARALLQKALDCGGILEQDSAIIEYILKTWDRHSLAAKQVVTAWINALADSRTWRQEPLESHPLMPSAGRPAVVQRWEV